MCGIFGVINKGKNKSESWRMLAVLNEDRGRDSAGLWIDGQTILRTTRITDALPEISDRPKVVLGHTRHATHGEVSITNTHPFTVGNITLAHNGVCTPYKWDSERYPCDSHALTASIARDGLKRALEKASGYWALWFLDDRDKNAVFFTTHRNNIAFHLGDNVAVFTSETRHLRQCGYAPNVTLQDHIVYRLDTRSLKLSEVLKHKEPRSAYLYDWRKGMASKPSKTINQASQTSLWRGNSWQGWDY